MNTFPAPSGQRMVWRFQVDETYNARPLWMARTSTGTTSYRTLQAALARAGALVRLRQSAERAIAKSRGRS